MRKVLITGATGFAGSFLLEYLKSSGEFSLYGTYHSESSLSSLSHLTNIVQFKSLNMLDKDATSALIGEVRPDYVFHLAAMTSPADSFKNPAETFTNNITSQLHLLEAIKEHSKDAKIMITSSAEVYGKVTSEDLPVNEQTPLRPASPYAVSKVAQDFLGFQYFTSYDLQIFRVRPFNHIGPRQSPAFVASAFAKQIAEIEKHGEGVMTVGNLEAKRDFTDVRDMVRAYALLMEKAAVGEVYNIGSGQSHQIQKILDTLLSFTTAKISVQNDESLMRPSDVPDMICDFSKMHEVTGWQPGIPLETTLKDILDYWRGIV